MCVLIFDFWFLPTTIVWNFSHTKNNSAIYCHKFMYCVYRHQSTHHSCRILIEREFSWQIFEKFSNIKCHQNPSNGSRIVPRGWTYVTKLIVTFRNVANMPKKELLPQNLDTASQLLSIPPPLNKLKLLNTETCRLDYFGSLQPIERLSWPDAGSQLWIWESQV
jgi:hypothetical protein